MNNLPEPDQIRDNESAIEMARIWIINKRPTFVINRQTWGNPSIWGALISDLIDHVASVYEEGGMERKEAMRLIETEYESRRGENKETH